jgi:hypothetical protein
MRSSILATFLALGTLVAVPAFAAPAQSEAPAKAQRAEGHKGGMQFPMAAAEFKAKVEQRQVKGRARMEERAAKLPADQAAALRAKFDAALQQVNTEVGKAIADGTVTKEEAKAVRAASPRHGEHACQGKGERGGEKNGNKK